VTLADSFFTDEETAPGFERTRRRRHMSPVPNARLARFFMGRETAPAFERTRRRLHMPPVPNARLARFFMGREIASGFEGTRRRRHMPPVPIARLARFSYVTGGFPPTKNTPREAPKVPRVSRAPRLFRGQSP